jgi:hypothetical protein
LLGGIGFRYHIKMEKVAVLVAIWDIIEKYIIPIKIIVIGINISICGIESEEFVKIFIENIFEPSIMVINHNGRSLLIINFRLSVWLLNVDRRGVIVGMINDRIA